MSKLEELGNNVVFTPAQEEMYPKLPALTLDFGSLANEMEGKYRKGHFNGVGIVVSKFFNIIQPDRAYFGQKDLQQFAVINRLVEDLSFGVQLRCMPILRESGGLALSSRNQIMTFVNGPLSPRHLCTYLMNVLMDAPCV